MRPILIVVAAMVAIGILVWKKTPTLDAVDCPSRCWRDCLDLPERSAPLDKLMTKDEARKIAAGIAKLPELLNRPQHQRVKFVGSTATPHYWTAQRPNCVTESP
jgi:hypothetical protein